MIEFDSIDEILEFAIGREVEANQLYIYLAGQMKEPQMRELFEELAEEELEHKARLELEIMKEGRVVATGGVPGLRIADYIENVEEDLDIDYRGALTLGINKEDVSVKLYSDLVAIVKDEESRKTLLSLAQEEAEHKKRFEIEYQNLLKEA